MRVHTARLLHMCLHIKQLNCRSGHSHKQSILISTLQKAQSILLLYLYQVVSIEPRVGFFFLDAECRNILKWYDPDSFANTDDVPDLHASCFSTSEDSPTEKNSHKLSIFCQVVYRYRRVSYVKANPGKYLSSHVVPQRHGAPLCAPNLRQTSANLLGSVSHEQIKTNSSDSA
jgi:hypothetical protein